MNTEAPEKIYIVNDDLNIKREWYKTKQVGFGTTEYIRTDAFIEKAEEFIYSALNDGIMGTANIEDFMRLQKLYGRIVVWT